MQCLTCSKIKKKANRIKKNQRITVYFQKKNNNHRRSKRNNQFKSLKKNQAFCLEYGEEDKVRKKKFKRRIKVYRTLIRAKLNNLN